MSPADHLLAEARRHGLILRPTQSGVHYRAAEAPPRHLLNALKSHKAALREALLLECRSVEDKEAGSVWCRWCWRYKRDACAPGEYRLARGGASSGWKREQVFRLDKVERAA